MKWIKNWKVFENIDYNQDYNQEDIEDIFIDMDFHNLKVDQISTGNSIELTSDFVTNGRDFIIKDDNTYESLSIKLIRTGDLEYTDEFFEELKLCIERLEKVFNLKFKCIFLRTNLTWWIRTIDLFKDTIFNILSSGDLTTEREKSDLKKPYFILLTFERL
jgi:hypothetical protein